MRNNSIKHKIVAILMCIVMLPLDPFTECVSAEEAFLSESNTVNEDTQGKNNTDELIEGNESTPEIIGDSSEMLSDLSFDFTGVPEKDDNVGEDIDEDNKTEYSDDFFSTDEDVKNVEKNNISEKGFESAAPEETSIGNDTEDKAVSAEFELLDNGSVAISWVGLAGNTDKYRIMRNDICLAEIMTSNIVSDIYTYTDSFTLMSCSYEYYIEAVSDNNVFAVSEKYNLLTQNILSVSSEDNYTLEEDTVVISLEGNGTVRTNGFKLIVTGNTKIDSIDMFDGGSFVCFGDAEIENIYMSAETDNYLLICGNLTITGSCSLYAGIIEIRGNLDIDYYSFYTNENVKFIFSGGTEQHVVFRRLNNYAYFQISYLVNNNTSDKGISFDYFMPAIRRYEKCEGARLNWCGRFWEVLSVENVTGDVYVDSDCILNCYNSELTLEGSLTVKGDLYISGGYFNINGGTLSVSGSIYVANPEYSFEVSEDDTSYIRNHDDVKGTEWENKAYEYACGSIIFQGGRIHTGGDFIWASSSCNTYMYEGLLEVEGDILIDRTRFSYSSGYYTSEYSVILCGTSVQHVGVIAQNYYYPEFRNFKITNKSDAGVVFVPWCERCPLAIGAVELGDSKTTGKLCVPYGTDVAYTDSILWLITSGATPQGKTDVYGDILFYNSNAYIASDTELTVHGNMTLSDCSLNIYGKLNVTGDLSIKRVSTCYYSYFNNNSEITVEGDLNLLQCKSTGDYSISNSELLIYEDANLNVEGSLNMDHFDIEMMGVSEYALEGAKPSKISIGKDIILNEKTRIDNSGELLIQGNLYTFGYDNIVNCENGRTIFCGNEKQTIQLDSGSILGIAEISNTSDNGVVFEGAGKIVELIDNGNIYSATGEELPKEYNILSNAVLSDNLTVEGDLVIGEGEIDLNGYTLTVKGNLIHPKGSINVGKGKLYVQGDYLCKGVRTVTDGTVVIDDDYNSSYGKLVMQESEGRTVVYGSLNIKSYYFGDQLSAGELTVYGDMQEGINIAGETLLVIAGNMSQKIGWCTVRNISINNASAFFEGLSVYGNIATNGNEINCELNIRPSTTFSEDTVKADLSLYISEADSECYLPSVIDGDLTIDGYSIKYSVIIPAITITGNLTIEGGTAVLSSDSDEGIHIYGNALLKNSDDTYYSYAKNPSAKMMVAGENTVVTIDGDIVLYYGGLLNGNQGEIILHGNIDNLAGRIELTGKTILIFDGSTEQTIRQCPDDSFAIIKIDNSSERGVVSNYAVRKALLLNCTSDTDIAYDEYNSKRQYYPSYGDVAFTLENDMTVKHIIADSSVKIDLNGHRLSVEDDLYQSFHLEMNGGSLFVAGDYSVRDIKMTEEEEYIFVGGDFRKSNYYNLEFTDGTLEVKGDVIIAHGYNTKCVASGNHTLILSGEEEQHVINNESDDFSVITFNNVEITNTSANGVFFDAGTHYGKTTYVNVCGHINDHGKKVTGFIKPGPSVTYENNHYSGSVLYNHISDLKTGDEVTIDGDMSIVWDEDIDFSLEESLYIKGDLSVTLRNNATDFSLPEYINADGKVLMLISENDITCNITAPWTVNNLQIKAEDEKNGEKINICAPIVVLSSLDLYSSGEVEVEDTGSVKAEKIVIHNGTLSNSGQYENIVVGDIKVYNDKLMAKLIKITGNVSFSVTRNRSMGYYYYDGTMVLCGNGIQNLDSNYPTVIKSIIIRDSGISQMNITGVIGIKLLINDDNISVSGRYELYEAGIGSVTYEGNVLAISQDSGNEFKWDAGRASVEDGPGKDMLSFSDSAVTVNGNLVIYGNFVISQPLTVKGNVDIYGSVIIEGGSIDVSQNLTVNGKKELSALIIGETGNIKTGNALLCSGSCAELLVYPQKDSMCYGLRSIIVGGDYRIEYGRQVLNCDLYVAGNFSASFSSGTEAEYNNTIFLNGSSKKKQTFSAGKLTDGFHNIVFSNPTGITLSDNIKVNGTIKDVYGNITASYSWIYLEDLSQIDGEKISGKIYVGRKYSMDEVDQNGTGEEPDAVLLEKNLKVTGSLTLCSPIILAGHELEVTDELKVKHNGQMYFYDSDISMYGKIIMSDSKDVICADSIIMEGADTLAMTSGTVKTNIKLIAESKSSVSVTGSASLYIMDNNWPNASSCTISVDGECRFSNIISARKNVCCRYSGEEVGLGDMGETVTYESPFTIDVSLADCNKVTLTIKLNNKITSNQYFYIYRDGVSIAKVSCYKTYSYTDSSVVQDTEYLYRIVPYSGRNIYNGVAESVTVVTAKDVEYPTKPANVYYKASGSAVTLSWNASSDNVKVAGYNVYCNGILIAENINALNYKHTGLQEGKKYIYSIEAVDTSGNKSSKSDIVEAVPYLPQIVSVSPQDGAVLADDFEFISVRYLHDDGHRDYYLKAELKAGDTWNFINSNYAYVYVNWYYKDYVGDKAYTLRITLYDNEGNSDSRVMTYRVDHEPPARPEKLYASCVNGIAGLSWVPSSSADCVRYYLYYYDVDEGVSKQKQITYLSADYTSYPTINGLTVGKTYVFRLTAMDRNGNISEYRDSAPLLIEKDEQPPKVTSFKYQYNRSRVNGSARFYYSAEDNKDIKSFAVEQCKDDGKEKWQTIFKYDVEKSAYGTTFIHNYNKEFYWYTPGLEDGAYRLRAYATDAAGNRSEYVYGRYVVDNTGIAKIRVTKKEASNTYVRLEWENVSEDDFSYFLVERKNGNDWAEVAKVQNTLGCYIQNLTPTTSYVFRVVGYDDIGNRGIPSDDIQIETKTDITAPVITYVGPVQGTYGKSIEINVRAEDDHSIGYAVFSISRDGKDYRTIAKVCSDGTCEEGPGAAGQSGQKRASAQKSGNAVSLGYNYSLEDEEEGTVYIKTVVYDSYGNRNRTDANGNEAVCRYVVDHTAPEMVKGFHITDNDGYIGLEWDLPKDDAVAFRIYRAGENGIYGLINDYCRTINYYDTGVEYGASYSYKIAALDSAGNESVCTDPLHITVAKDDEAPVICTVIPSSGSKLGVGQGIELYVRDNSALSKIIMEQGKPEDENVWMKAGEKAINGSAYSGYMEWNTDGLESGKYRLRFTAEDINGNRSEAYTVTYDLDAETPNIVSINTASGHFKNEITIECEDTGDLDRIEIKRRISGAEKWSSIGSSVFDAPG